jgi:hypothetical protein
LTAPPSAILLRDTYIENSDGQFTKWGSLMFRVFQDKDFQSTAMIALLIVVTAIVIGSASKDSMHRMEAGRSTDATDGATR